MALKSKPDSERLLRISRVGEEEGCRYFAPELVVDNAPHQIQENQRQRFCDDAS
jgi:hypothetical protein